MVISLPCIPAHSNGVDTRPSTASGCITKSTVQRDDWHWFCCMAAATPSRHRLAISCRSLAAAGASLRSNNKAADERLISRIGRSVSNNRRRHGSTAEASGYRPCRPSRFQQWRDDCAPSGDPVPATGSPAHRDHSLDEAHLG
jgi:hypothetical protein